MMYGFVIPTLGWNLLAKLLKGDQLVISRVMVGRGRMLSSGDPASLTDLIEPVAAATSTIPVTSGNTASFIVEYRSDLNGGLTENFWLSEFGVFAIDPDVGEILLYYGSLGDYPQHVSAYSSGSIDIKRFPVSIILTDEIDVILNYPAVAFMTSEDIDAYFQNIAMPILLAGAQDLIDQHNLDPNAHPIIQAWLEEFMGRMGRLEDMFMNNITGNPFLITFSNLDGLTVTGVWNQPLARIEF